MLPAKINKGSGSFLEKGARDNFLKIFIESFILTRGGRVLKKLVLLTIAVVLSGCGVKRQSVALNIPAPHIRPANGSPIVVSSIIDNRVLKFDGSLKDNEKAGNVGGEVRHGNGFIVNLDNESVVDEMRTIVIQALRDIGYKDIDISQAGKNVPRLVIDIKKFGVYAPLKFWRAATYSQQMIADIVTKVTIKSNGVSKTIVVKGHGTNVYQRVVPENWEIALNKAIVDYTNHFQQKIVAQ